MIFDHINIIITRACDIWVHCACSQLQTFHLCPRVLNIFYKRIVNDMIMIAEESEMRMVLSALPDRLTNDEIDEMLRTADIDKDGELYLPFWKFVFVLE